MSQYALFPPDVDRAVPVAELTRMIRDRLDSAPELQNVWVVGEVSNASQPNSGHFYFTLKDAQASLRCVMWKSQVQRVRFLPRSGDMVEVHGSISVYEAGGQYQLYADTLRPAGQGQLYQEFLRLKALLESEGLFDPARKRPVPAWPHTIGIVTSPTGAALQDMLNTLRRRFPLAEVVLAPSPVQGIDAPPRLADALRRLAEDASPDVILLARGGGSIEDLWAFNDEGVARAVAASPVPVITGIGHETDFTLADFAADLRAPTPTAAAEMATPDAAELQVTLGELDRQLHRAAAGVVTEKRWALTDARNRLLRHTPEVRLRNDRQLLDERAARLKRAFHNETRLRRLRFNALLARLQSANPATVLQRGFAIVTGPDGQVVRSTGDVHPGDRVHIRVRDGSLDAEIVQSDQNEPSQDSP